MRLLDPRCRQQMQSMSRACGHAARSERLQAERAKSGRFLTSPLSAKCCRPLLPPSKFATRARATARQRAEERCRNHSRCKPGNVCCVGLVTANPTTSYGHDLCQSWTLELPTARVQRASAPRSAVDGTNAGAHRLSEATMLYGSSPPPAPRPATPSTHHHAVCRPQRTRMRYERSSR